jgi:pyridoxine 5'-phosphate oxidase-like protein
LQRPLEPKLIKTRSAVGVPGAGIWTRGLWLVPVHRQVRVAEPVERVSEGEADEYWSTRAPAVRLSAATSHQIRVVASRAVLEMQVWDMLRRRPGGADVPRPRRWGGFRVLPSRVESWQESPDGLRDRIRYHREAAAGSSSGCRRNDPAAAPSISPACPRRLDQRIPQSSLASTKRQISGMNELWPAHAPRRVCRRDTGTVNCLI